MMLMAKKAAAKPSTKSKPARPSARSKSARVGSAPSKDRIIDALMGLFATRDFANISLADIAEEAGIPLAELREFYDGKLAILADFSRRIDRIVLEDGPAEGDCARDRLFDILMRRFDALTPYKEAVGRLMRALRCDPRLAGFAHCNAMRAAKAMQVGADAEKSGVFGALTRQGLVLVHAETLRVWLDDDDPGLARTMAALDQSLGRGERAMKFVGGVCATLRPFLHRDRATRDGTAAADA
jgi:AcrR family transcriptional regulator